MQPPTSPCAASTKAEDQPIVKALVCDRTFASLDSVASRLLGKWAAQGLWYLGCWRTNSISDYTKFVGTKIILQDPQDQVVHHFASLQAGVATVEIEGGSTASSSYFWPRTMDKKLAMSSLEKKAPQLRRALAALGHATAIHAPNSPGLPLSPRGDEGNSSNSSNSSARIVDGGLDSIASALTASIVSLTHHAQCAAFQCTCKCTCTF